MIRGSLRPLLWLTCLLPACGYDPKIPKGTETSDAASDSVYLRDTAGDLPRDTRDTVARAADAERRVPETLDAVSGIDAVSANVDTDPVSPDVPTPDPDTGLQPDAPLVADGPIDRPQDMPVRLDISRLPPDTAIARDTGLAPPPDAPPPIPDTAQPDTKTVCPRPIAVENANILYGEPIGPGTVASYTCVTGYRPTTTVTRVCQADGTWNGQDPVCTPVDCGAPPTIANGTRTFGATTYLNEAKYSCSGAYLMSGSDTVTCQADGTWSALPTCARPQYRLTITKTGSGTGTVTDAATGIACGTTCQVNLDAGTTVNLTAAGTDATQTFIGWETSLCSGRGACSFAISANTVISAFFSPPPNIMFVTSTTQTANLGGLAGADALCDQRAHAATPPLQGTYKALLSTATASAASRLGAASGWVRPDGKPVFNRLADIALERIFYPPRLDENGTDVGNALVMTASLTDGTVDTYNNATTCSDFAAAPSSSAVTVGFASGSSSAFIARTTYGCQEAQRIYCLGVDKTSAFLPPAPATGRYAFTTSGSWGSGGGIASADSFCQTEATQAGLPGTYKALLAANGKTAAERFNTGGSSWIRTDGLPLTATASGFFSASLLDITPNKSADGTQYIGTVMAWSGAQTMTTAGTNATTCFDWMSTVSTDKGFSGETGVTFATYFFGSFYAGCDRTLRLVCLQE